MCTVSIIPIAPGADGPARGGFRLVTSRDESRARAEALPPEWRTTADGARALWPVDARGGGTWVGVSEGGLVLALLNRNPIPAPQLPAPELLRSRGTIIPALLGLGTPSAVLRGLARLPLGRYAPFTLVTAAMPEAGPVTVRWAAWDRSALVIAEPVGAPVCLASSGLGDEIVAGRVDLFERVVARAPSPESQDAFHRHRWRDRPAQSVLMWRPDARTVSITGVEVRDGPGGRRVAMRYAPVSEHETAGDGTGSTGPVAPAAARL